MFLQVCHLYVYHNNLLIHSKLKACFYCYFLFLYYFQLDISLLAKSGALLAGGALMLAGAYLLDRKEWAV